VSGAGLYRKLRGVYSGWYLLLNLTILLAYYVIIERLLAIQQFGVVFSAAPAYLVVLLAVSSSVLMTVAVYTVMRTRKGRALGYEEGAASGVTALLGGIMSGCGCQGAFLYSGLTILVGSGEAFAVNTVFAEHIGIVLGALTIFNIAFIVYSLGRLPGGRAK